MSLGYDINLMDKAQGCVSRVIQSIHAHRAGANDLPQRSISSGRNFASYCGGSYQGCQVLGANKSGPVEISPQRGSGAGRGLRGSPGSGFDRHSHFPGAGERTPDIFVFRTGIERNQPVAVLAVGLKPIADFLRPFPEHLRAFGAFDFHFFVDHGVLPRNPRVAICLPRLKGAFEGLLKLSSNVPAALASPVVRAAHYPSR